MRKTPFKQSCLSKCHYYWTVIKSLIKKKYPRSTNWRNRTVFLQRFATGCLIQHSSTYCIVCSVIRGFALMSAWSSERRLRTESDHNYFETLIQAISCHQFVEVFLSWSVCIIKSTLHTHLIWRQFRVFRICTCMRRKTKHIRSASPCALEHCAFFNCIISVRLLSRAGYKLVSKVHSFEVWSQPVLLSRAPHQLISTKDLT